MFRTVFDGVLVSEEEARIALVEAAEPVLGDGGPSVAGPRSRLEHPARVVAIPPMAMRNGRRRGVRSLMSRSSPDVLPPGPGRSSSRHQLPQIGRSDDFER